MFMSLFYICRRKYSTGNSDYMALKVENVKQCQVGVQSSENKSEKEMQGEDSFRIVSLCSVHNHDTVYKGLYKRPTANSWLTNSNVSYTV